MKQASPIPICPFCEAPWTASMLADLDRYTGASSCACCAPGQHQEEPLKVAEVPTQDLCCDACGKPIYRALA